MELGGLDGSASAPLHAGIDDERLVPLADFKPEIEIAVEVVRVYVGMVVVVGVGEQLYVFHDFPRFICAAFCRVLGVVMPFRVVGGVFGDSFKGGFHEGNRDAVVILAGDAELAIWVVSLAVGADDLCDGVHAQAGIVAVARPALLLIE